MTGPLHHYVLLGLEGLLFSTTIAVMPTTKLLFATSCYDLLPYYLRVTTTGKISAQPLLVDCPWSDFSTSLEKEIHTNEPACKGRVLQLISVFL